MSYHRAPAVEPARRLAVPCDRRYPAPHAYAIANRCGFAVQRPIRGAGGPSMSYVDEDAVVNLESRVSLREPQRIWIMPAVEARQQRWGIEST